MDGAPSRCRPVAVECLARHTASANSEERLAAGSALAATEGLRLPVFRSGHRLDPSRCPSDFRAAVGKRTGISDAAVPVSPTGTRAVSLLLDGGARIEEVADLLGDDPRTLYRHYRHKVRPIAEVATRMEAVLSGTAAGPPQT